MVIISTRVGVLVLIMFLFLFSFCLGLSPVDVARGRRVQTVLRGVLVYTLIQYVIKSTLQD